MNPQYFICDKTFYDIIIKNMLFYREVHMSKGSLTGDDVYRAVCKAVNGGINPREDVITVGVKSASVKKILLCWMADVNTIKHAAKTGADLIIAHESPFFPYNAAAQGNAPEYMTWHTNINRMKALFENGISVIRMHLPLDNHIILREFTKALGLCEPAESWVYEGNKLRFNVFDIEPVAYGDFISHVKKTLGVPALRASAGDVKRIVKRLGIPWGGIGLFINVSQLQSFLDKNCDVLITGETDNYGMRFVMEAGALMVEAGHEVSENFGIRAFADELAGFIPEIPVEFYENKPPFMFM
jgi:putative NIF3 family GTP cyclohydrolase 1 type 2